MQTFTLKKISAVLALMMAAVLSLTLVACGSNDEEVIREGVTSEFEAMKNPDDAGFQELVGAFTGSADLSSLGVDNEEFCKAWLDGFDYSIDSVKVDGNNAEVEATVTVKSLSEAIENWQDEFFEFLETDEALEMTETELQEKAGEMLMDTLAQAPMMTNTVTMPYVLDDRTWVQGPGFEEALTKAFIGNL